jgi:predicted DNA repair protein MutK
MAGPAAGAVQWIVKALGGAVVGLFVGGLIVLVVRQLTSRPEDLIVD